MRGHFDLRFAVLQLRLDLVLTEVVVAFLIGIFRPCVALALCSSSMLWICAGSESLVYVMGGTGPGSVFTLLSDVGTLAKNRRIHSRTRSIALGFFSSTASTSRSPEAVSTVGAGPAFSEATVTLLGDGTGAGANAPVVGVGPVATAGCSGRPSGRFGERA